MGKYKETMGETYEQKTDIEMELATQHGDAYEEYCNVDEL